MKKWIAFLLTLLILTGCFASCRSTEKPPADTGTTPAADSREEPDVTENPLESLDLPSNLDFGGEEVRILQRTGTKDEMYSAKYTGDLVMDTIFERNEYVKQALKVELKFSDVQGTNTSYSEYRSAITNSAFADQPQYHIIANYAYFSAALATEGLYYSLLELNPVKTNYLNLEKVWWNDNYTQEATINEKLYFIEGDVTITAINRLEVLFYNMNLASSYFPDVNFLEVVNNRQWTYSYFLECVQAAGSGEETGTWGITMPCNSTSIDGFIAALGVDIIQRNSRDVPEVSFNTDRTVSIAQALRKLYQENASAYALDGNTAPTVDAFLSGKAIFHINMLQTAGTDSFKNTVFEYAIIPMPLWDELQEDYLVTAHDEYSTLSVPVNVVDTDRVSAVMELLGYTSYTNLRPALYEKTYKLRYLKTEPKAAMFDFIIDHAFFDFGYIYSYVMDNPVHVLRDNIRYPEKNQLVTDIASRATSSAAKLREFIAKLYE